MNAEQEKGGIRTFDCHSDVSTLGTRWKKWLTSFGYYADGKGLIVEEPIAGDAAQNRAQNLIRQRRRALLLHLAGGEVQEIFSTLDDTGEEVNYKQCVKVLNEYFVPQVNHALARQRFQQLTPSQGETVQQFSTRLRKTAADCNYGDDMQNHIRDAILWKCRSTYIRRRLLEEGDGLTLYKTLALASQ